MPFRELPEETHPACRSGSFWHVKCEGCAEERVDTMVWFLCNKWQFIEEKRAYCPKHRRPE